MYYKIFPIYNGSFSVSFGENLPYFKNIRDIPSFVFLLIGDDNEKILVDSGFATDYVPGIDSTFSRKPQEELYNALLELKVYPEEINMVIQTHLHWDHTGGMALFPQASFYVQSRELLGLMKVGPYEECSFKPNHWLPYLNRFKLIDGHYELKPGLNLLCSGKHTPGHQVVEVQTKSGKVILGGDVPFVYDQLWDMIPAEIWQQFRLQADSKFFWDEEVKSTVYAKLMAEEKANLINPQLISLPSIKSRADIFLASHDPRLRKISSL